MTVRQKEEVFILPIHMKIGVVFKNFEVESGEEISTTKRTTGVTALGAMDHSYDISSDLGSYCF
jgi:hypothetical protein